MGITVEQFLAKTSKLSNDSVIKMSNHAKDYTSKRPSCANSGYITYNGYGLEFVIDWSNRRVFRLGDFKTLLFQHGLSYDSEITSTDCDDGNMIDFDYIMIRGNTIILG